jgi:UPF0755 protein
LKRLVLWVFAPIVLIAIIASAAAGLWLFSELEKPYFKSQASEVFIEIPRGANVDKVAGLLTNAGVIKHSLPFRIYMRYAKLGRKIQAGEYRFDRSASPRQIAGRLIRGDVYFHSITIPEGLTARETIALLAKNKLGAPDDLERVLHKTEWIADLAPEARNLEGFLFPETYRFRRQVDSETIIRTMIDQFRLKLAKLLQAHPLQEGWTLSRIVILASLIEKEVMKAQEGPMVASVLINRLDKRMPLGCDATIIYAMKLAGTYEGRLGKKDMAMESPYNTYRNIDLPPGPICNPGADAIRSALNPARTDYFYYVSRNDGTHQFSKDLRAHINAVNLFQRSLVRRR